MAKVFIILLIIASGCMYSQEDKMQTDGMEAYWDPSEAQLFDFFRNFSDQMYDHRYTLKEHTLIVRLEDADKKIEFLRHKGKTEAADKTEQKILSTNQIIVSTIKEEYLVGDYLFYYPRDAKAIFSKGDTSLLYTDLETKAENVQLGNFAYVLQYKSLPTSNRAKFWSLHIWDRSIVKLYRLKGAHYSFSRFMNLRADIRESLRVFCREARLKNF